jgi:signal transduction histidine kinase
MRALADADADAELTAIEERLRVGALDAAPLALAAARLDDLCATSLDRFREAARRKHLRVSLGLTDCFARVTCDAARIEQILGILLSNAVKFTPAGGRLGLEATVDAARGQALLVVWDSGVGLGDDARRELLRPSEHPAPEPAGPQRAGLALALATRLITQHGGTLRVESEPGRGSRFSVEIPLLHAPANT